MATEIQDSRPTTSHIGEGPCAVAPGTDYTKRPGRYCGPNHDLRARRPLSEEVLEKFRTEAARLGRMLSDDERAAIIKEGQ